MRFLRRLVVLLLLLAAPLAAQDTVPRQRLRGVTLDHWGPGVGSAVFRPTFRATNLVRGRTGPDFAVVMFPDGMSLRPPFLTAGLQAGVAHRLPLGPASLLLKGGAAAIVAMGSGQERVFHIIPGLQAGLGLLVPLDAKSQLRADLTHHLYTNDSRTWRLWSFGAGFAVVLGGRR